MKSDHVSYSQLSLYEKCAYQWHMKYEKNIKDTTRSKHLEYGSAIHETLEVFFNMLCNKEGFELGEILNLYHYFLLKHDIPFDSLQEEMEWVLEGIDMINRLYHPKNEFEEMLVNSKILGVEKGFELFISDVKVVGYIDLILKTPDGIIPIDHKSGGKVYDRKKINTDLQIPIYAMAIKEMFGEYPPKGYYNFTRLHKHQEVVIHEERIEAAITRMNNIFNNMDKNSHAPKPCPLCYWCAYSKYQLNICRFSSSYKPKNAA